MQFPPREWADVSTAAGVRGGDNPSPYPLPQGERKQLASGTLPWGVLPEKQPGRFTLRLQLPNGNIPAGDLVKVAEIAERLGLGLVAATQQQDLLIPGVLEDSIAPAWNALKSPSLDVLRPRPKIVACPGAAICKLGLCRSPCLAEALAERFQAASIDSPVTIRISGCPNSCGNHPSPPLGWKGKSSAIKAVCCPATKCWRAGSPGKAAPSWRNGSEPSPRRRCPSCLPRRFPGG